jgi:hypothetical protein
MRRGLMVCAAVFAATLGINAQDSTKVTKESSVRIKDGDDVKVTGCVHRATSGFALSNLSGNSDRTPYFQLAFESESRREEVARHVGQKVEIEGKAAISDDARVEVQTKEKREFEDGPDEKLHTKTEIVGDMQAFPLLEVEHVKRISESCPSGS